MEVKFYIVLSCILFGVNHGLPGRSQRVIGGLSAIEGQYPSMASLRYNGEHYCGGVVISTSFILTAAHCIIGLSIQNLTILLGTFDLNNGGTVYNVSSIIAHPNYNSYLTTNDIGVLQTTHLIQFSALVQPISLETKFIGVVDSFLVGWGFTTYPGSNSPILQSVQLSTISVTLCQTRLQMYSIFQTQVCTLAKQGVGACQGDSGGALYSAGKLLGIVSWGMPCAFGFPDVYTRVSSFSNWTQQFLN